MQIKGIEGIPLITRFKTFLSALRNHLTQFRIEGIPLITRFKTSTTPEYAAASTVEY